MPIRRLLLVLPLALAAACGAGDAGAGDAVEAAARDLGRQLAGADDPVATAVAAKANVLEPTTDERLVVRISRTVDGGTFKGEHTAVHCYAYRLGGDRVVPERIECTGEALADVPGNQGQPMVTVVRD